jgi:hypothetical protein
MSQPFTDTTTLRLSAPLLVVINEGAETGLFELQLGSVIKIKRTQERLVKSARPASPRGNGVARHGHALYSVTRNSALQGINVFDYKNLRQLMSQIRPDSGQRPGNQHHTEKADKVSPLAEAGCCVGKTATVISLLMNDHWFCEGFI